MADPVLTDIYHAMVIAHLNGSPDPRERYINNFYFRNDEIQTSEGVADDILARLSDFYNGNHGPGGEAVADFYARMLDVDFDVIVYDLGQAPPRDPIARTFVATLPAGTTSNLPGELAICASYGSTDAPRTAPSTTGNPVPQRQRTGRVYLGPLQNGVLQSTTGEELDSREINPTVTATVTAAMEALATESLINRVRWVLLSRVLEDTYVIDYGWTDDAFDIQRRRGTPAKQRVEWSLA